MVIIKHPSVSRKYRTKRKRRAISPIKPIKRFSIVAYICKAIAIFLFICMFPFALAMLPFLLIVMSGTILADKINRFGGYFEDD